MLHNAPWPAWLQSVHHDGSARYVSDLYPRLGETVRLRLRLDMTAPVRRVILRTFPDGEQSLKLMQQTHVAPPVQWWETDLPISEPSVHYRFILDSADGVWHFAAAGPTAHVPLDSADFRILADYDAPGWPASSIFYQIFPDRFANGNLANDPKPEEFEFHGMRPHTYPWEEPHPPDQPFPIVFYGGDLEGITQRLDYLDELGINALYLTPIFTAYSNHKYDVADYNHVDPHFGGDEALIGLRQALSARGMRYILDIVPNHCGYWHSWFQTAQRNRAALEAEFFTFNQHPGDYVAWLGVWTLPKLNYSSQELRRRIYESPDAVFRRWLRPPYAADGWRIDVANMLGRQGPTQLGLEINRGIRRAVKETAADAYLLGENFFDATPQLQGDQLDGVMNYSGFTHPVWYWLSGYRQGAHGFAEQITADHWPTEAMVQTWQSRRAAIPWVIALQQYNVLDSHDTPRIRSVVRGNDALHRLAAVIQFTYPGLVGMYYGDEIGMEDDTQLASRGCMIWDEKRWNGSLRAFYRDLIALRRRSDALQRGGFQVLHVQSDTVAYQREGADERFLVVAHRHEKPRPAGELPVRHGGIADGTRFVEHFGGHQVTVENGRLQLPELSQGATIWREI